MGSVHDNGRSIPQRHPNYLSIDVSPDDVALLWMICNADGGETWRNPRELVEHLARSAADGARRPGSWERGWIVQATGADLPYG